MIIRLYLFSFVLINSTLFFNLTADPKPVKAARAYNQTDNIEKITKQIEDEKKQIEKLKGEKEGLLKKYFPGKDIALKNLAKELNIIEKELKKKENEYNKLLKEKAKLDEIHRGVENASNKSLDELTKQQNVNEMLKKETTKLEGEAYDFKAAIKNGQLELYLKLAKHSNAQNALIDVKEMPSWERDVYANAALDQINKELQNNLIEVTVKAAHYKKMLDDKSEENRRIKKTIEGYQNSIKNYEDTLNNNITDGKSDPISTATHPKQKPEAHALDNALKNCSPESMKELVTQSTMQNLEGAYIISRGEENIDVVDVIVEEINDRTMGFAKKHPKLNVVAWLLASSAVTYLGLSTFNNK